VGAGFPDFHIIMIVDYGDVTPPGTGCGSPSNVAWLSATPKTGTINGIGTKNVTVKANAASLTAGTYGGLMCVNTNDLAHPQFEIPVTFTVTPNIANDTIFKNGFDGAPPVDPDVVTGTINLPVQADGDGSTLDFVTGLYGTYDANRVDDVNLYDYGDGTLTVYWYGDASALVRGWRRRWRRSRVRRAALGRRHRPVLHNLGDIEEAGELDDWCRRLSRSRIRE
jgi:hypothetical protein